MRDFKAATPWTEGAEDKKSLRCQGFSLWWIDWSNGFELFDVRWSDTTIL